MPRAPIRDAETLRRGFLLTWCACISGRGPGDQGHAARVWGQCGRPRAQRFPAARADPVAPGRADPVAPGWADPVAAAGPRSLASSGAQCVAAGRGQRPALELGRLEHAARPRTLHPTPVARSVGQAGARRLVGTSCGVARPRSAAKAQQPLIAAAVAPAPSDFAGHRVHPDAPGVHHSAQTALGRGLASAQGGPAGRGRRRATITPDAALPSAAPHPAR